MQKACANSWCKQKFEINDDDLQFLEKLSPVIAGTRYDIPPPTHCPECRQQRRYACRNDRHYYQGTCHVCGKSLITSYSPDKGIPVLCDSCFWSDKWDPLSFGRAFDFAKSFSEQFKMLRETVPRLAIWHTQSENSDYTVHSSRNRNCYMASSLVDNEEVHFSDFVFRSRDCMELFSCDSMELCYECAFCIDCFGCDYCENCSNFSDSVLCFDCRGGGGLIGCVGLRNQRNKILNRDTTAQERNDVRHKLNTDPTFRTVFQEKFNKLKLQHPHPAAWTVNAERCTGNEIWHSKNAQHGYNIWQQEDTRYIYECRDLRDVMDACRIGDGEMLYDCASIVDLQYSAFCNLTYQCDHLLYCDNCNGTKNSFGSISLKKHQYCILNKQYTKEDYEVLMPKMIEHMKKTGEWGEFFPIVISPFGYNETKAHEWYPLNEEGVQAREWKWSRYEQPMPKNVKTVKAAQLPNEIGEVPDDVLNWAIVCEVTNRPFRIIKQELEFYRKRGLPLPKRSPTQRHYDRIAPHNIRILYDRTCGKCGKSIQTIYAPERPEVVYCEECYLQTVY